MPRGDFWPNWKDRLDAGYKETPTGCWEWQRSRNGRGYGVIYLNGKNHLAHRAAWLKEHGRWPADGKVIDHICENKACINPKHLRELDNWQNIRRAYQTDSPETRRQREKWRAATARHRKNYSANYTPMYEGGEENSLV